MFLNGNRLITAANMHIPWPGIEYTQAGGNKGQVYNFKMMKPWNICGSKTGFYLNKKSRAREWEKNALSLWISHHRVRARRRLVWIFSALRFQRGNKNKYLLCGLLCFNTAARRDANWTQEDAAAEIKEKDQSLPLRKICDFDYCPVWLFAF